MLYILRIRKQCQINIVCWFSLDYIECLLNGNVLILEL